MTHSITVKSPTDITSQTLAERLAQSIKAPLAVLLHGDVGAGKSHISRALIRAWAGAQIDVPSPTFTLVQSYDTPKGGIWHVDLYRLGDTQELIELGLLEALESNLCLIEWPDLAAEFINGPRLDITITANRDTRDVTLTAAAEILNPIIDTVRRDGSFSVSE